MNNNKQTKKPGSTRTGLKRLLSLHRTLGLTSALFVIILAVTGLLLQHASRLGLDNNFLRADLWLSWYNVEVPQISTSYESAGRYASLIGDALYFESTYITDGVADLQGMVTIEGGFVAASSERLIFINDDAELIEVLSSVHGVPQPIGAVSQGPDSSLFILAGNDVYQGNLELLEFEVLVSPAEQPVWNSPVPIDAPLSMAIREDYGDRLLSWERLILDVHSGRFIGEWGVILVDFMAILFLTMAVTGVLIWSRRRSVKQSR